MTESATIRIDFTPYRRVPFYPHDTGTKQLMQVYGLHKGVPVTNLPKCTMTLCQAPISAETTPSPLSGAASNIPIQSTITSISHPHTMQHGSQKVIVT